MKRMMLMMLVALLIAVAATLAEAPVQKDLTLMLYICGSNLESQYGSASDDINEILYSGVDTRRVNVLVMTGGSKRWTTGQHADEILVSAMRGTQMVTRWKTPAQSMGDPDTLRSFVDWSVENCPAEEYALILWDHGAGPLEGICLDELNTPDRLSISELAEALGDSALPGRLKWIGFDACLMSTVEVASRLASRAEYMIASQETEPAAGWNYGFLAGIERDEDGTDTGRRIVDMYFEGANEGKANLTMACLDLDRIGDVAQTMDAFFAPLGKAMNADTFAELSGLRLASNSFGKVVRGITDMGYDLVDLGDLIDHCGALGDSGAVREALSKAVVYSRSDNADACGLSVYHPLRNKEGYLRQWKEDYASLYSCEGYQQYMDAFGTLLTGGKLADWSNIRLTEEGVDESGENHYSLQLTPAQMENFASAQLMVLGAETKRGTYDVQLSAAGEPDLSGYEFYPVSVEAFEPDESGLLAVNARYGGNSLYMVDEWGNIQIGPISYNLSDDGEYWYIYAYYKDLSGRENAMPPTAVIYTCRVNERGTGLDIVDTEVYDRVTGTYTRRIDFSESDYTRIGILNPKSTLPGEGNPLPGYADWPKEKYTAKWLETGEMPFDLEYAFLPLDWRLELYPFPMTGAVYYATLQITDTQQNTYCTPPVRVKNPFLHEIGVLPATQETEDYALTLHVVEDASPNDYGLTLGLEIRNNTDTEIGYSDILDRNVVLNGTLTAKCQIAGGTTSEIGPGETGSVIFRIDGYQYLALSQLTSIDFVVETIFHGEDGEGRRAAFSWALEDTVDYGDYGTYVLDAKTVRGIQWELCSLSKARTGDLTGTLHICNSTDEPFVAYGNPVINDIVQFKEDALDISVEPHTETYMFFVLFNSMLADSALYPVPGMTEATAVLGVDRILERFGVEEITSLSLHFGKPKDDPWSVRFEWTNPIPFASREEVEQARAETTQKCVRLVDGDVSVDVERVFVTKDWFSGDVRAFVSLFVRNRTDQMVPLDFLNTNTVNGELWRRGGYIDLAGGACAVVYARLCPMAWEDGTQEISEIGLNFSCGAFEAQGGLIRMNHPVSVDVPGGTYLSPEDFEVVPATFERLVQDEPE